MMIIMIINEYDDDDDDDCYNDNNVNISDVSSSCATATSLSSKAGVFSVPPLSLSSPSPLFIFIFRIIYSHQFLSPSPLYLVQLYLYYLILLLFPFFLLSQTLFPQLSLFNLSHSQNTNICEQMGNIDVFSQRSKNWYFSLNGSCSAGRQTYSICLKAPRDREKSLSRLERYCYLLAPKSSSDFFHTKILVLDNYFYKSF